MKHIIALIALFLSIQLTKANDCTTRVVEVINKMGPASDYPYRINTEPKLLKAQTPLVDFYGTAVRQYNTDKLLYAFSGSYHSGWFEEVAVVNPKTCWVIEFVNTYSE